MDRRIDCNYSRRTPLQRGRHGRVHTACALVPSVEPVASPLASSRVSQPSMVLKSPSTLMPTFSATEVVQHSPWRMARANACNLSHRCQLLFVSSAVLVYIPIWMPPDGSSQSGVGSCRSGIWQNGLGLGSRSDICHWEPGAKKNKHSD